MSCPHSGPASLSCQGFSGWPPLRGHPPSDCRTNRQARPQSICAAGPGPTPGLQRAQPGLHIPQPGPSRVGQPRSHLCLDLVLCRSGSTWAGGWPGAGTFTGPRQSWHFLPALWKQELQQGQAEQTAKSPVEHGQREVTSPCHPGYSGVIPGCRRMAGRRKDLGPHGGRRKELPLGHWQGSSWLNFPGSGGAPM